ncbi:MAG: 16S rRNA (adenine(1518)-N(6)/adenine(1519)-N(6))-dimethyltransferase RsmA [Candidatus Lokiarchaeia archaeon]|nr:16S rRNA (adenine(1518)-N(6)/adenine(1519)-N(6))-dimethyltransferase RsmA [Candidatus Lokiarchaeia archaeon]
MNQMKIIEPQLIFKQLKIEPNKNLGQNFIVDKNITKKIIDLSKPSQNDVVLEIGSGLGSLTQELINLVKKLYAVEIDHRLYKYLDNEFSIYDNIEVIRGDILKIDLPKHNKVISNIPYTITGLILEKIFFRLNPPIGVLTIEKSIADRIFLTLTYKKFSRISISVNAFMKPVLKSPIPRKSFWPIPKIDLSLIKLIPIEELNAFFLENEAIKSFLKFIAGIMPYKNRNIANAIELFFKNHTDIQYSKDDILLILRKNSFENRKVFTFEIDDYIEICKLFYSKS